MGKPVNGDVASVYTCVLSPLPAQKMLISTPTRTRKNQHGQSSAKTCASRDRFKVKRMCVSLEVLHDGAVRVSGCLFCLSLVRCPQGEVVAEELHDEGGVFVGLLRESVELCDRIVEGLRD